MASSTGHGDEEGGGVVIISVEMLLAVDFLVSIVVVAGHTSSLDVLKQLCGEE